MNNKAVKFEIIHEIINQPDNVLVLDELCKTAGVSKSGYYYWLNSSDFRKEKEAQDQADFDLILAAVSVRLN